MKFAYPQKKGNNFLKNNILWLKINLKICLQFKI